MNESYLEQFLPTWLTGNKTEVLELPASENLEQRIAMLIKATGETPLIIPKGFELTLIPSATESQPKGHCGSCGAPSTLFMPACGNCGTGKAHYALKQLGVHITEEMPMKLAAGRTIVRKGEVKGVIASNEIDVEEGSSVGVVFGNDVTFDGRNQATAIHGIDVKLRGGINSGDIIAMSLEAGKLISPKVVITQEGYLVLGRGSNINLLCLDHSVKMPNLKGVSVNRIIKGDFQMPALFPHDLRKLK